MIRESGILQVTLTTTDLEADLDVIESSYRAGRVLHGDSAIADVPIIDVDLYSDLNFDIHDRFRLFSVRDRMEGAEGDPDHRTRVIWTREGGGLTNLVTAPLPTVEMVGLLTEWLEATTDGTPVADARPESITDSCEEDGTTSNSSSDRSKLSGVIMASNSLISGSSP